MSALPLLLLVAFAPILFSQKAGKPTPASKAWVLTFADEFDGPQLDLTRWIPHDPWGHVRDRQLQAWVPEALEVGGGQLHIVARRAANREYVSGILGTFGTFAQTYGRFEIRCRIPAGRGLRPAFRLLPIPLGPLPAIDVFQTAGNSPSKIFFANHWGTEQTERSFGDAFNGPDLSTGFHTISIEWDPGRIAWFVDDKEKFYSTDGVPHQPMYLLVELAVDGTLAQSPASFDIDYIRVYRRP